MTDSDDDDIDQYVPDRLIEDVLDQHFADKRFRATEVIDRLRADRVEGSDSDLLDRVGQALTLRTDDDGALMYLHTTDPALEVDGWPMFFAHELATIAELETFADQCALEAERLDAVAEALDRLAAARRRNGLRLIK